MTPSANKNQKNVKNFCLLVETVRGGVPRGLMGRGGGGGGGGGVVAIVGGGGGGSTVGLSSTSKNRPSHHKYKSPKQFELKQS